MKKTLIILSALALILTACGKDEPTNPSKSNRSKLGNLTDTLGWVLRSAPLSVPINVQLNAAIVPVSNFATDYPASIIDDRFFFGNLDNRPSFLINEGATRPADRQNAVNTVYYNQGALNWVTSPSNSRDTLGFKVINTYTSTSSVSAFWRIGTPTDTNFCRISVLTADTLKFTAKYITAPGGPTRFGTATYTLTH
jgi:hypothetical protein